MTSAPLSDPGETTEAVSKQVDTLLDTAIRQGLMQAYVYSKAQFATAKDTKEMLTVADENAKLLMHIIRYKLEGRIEEMMAERIEDSLSDGDMHVRVGNKLYKVTDLLSERPEATTEQLKGAINKDGEV